jgi:hypothetical protein
MLTADDLRARIPGWELISTPRTGRQCRRSGSTLPLPAPIGTSPSDKREWPRERSIEHKFLTLVFGTYCPPKGLWGTMRKLAYRCYRLTDRQASR